jgi:serine/threonine protein kinase
MISSERYCSSCGAANRPDAVACFACGLSLKTTAPLAQDAADYPLLQARYRILSQLGSGGFSAVYKAIDTHSDHQIVAIKAISLAHLSTSEVIEATEAFNREVQVLADLKHPSIPRMHTHFADADSWYLVVDFIEGVTLEKYLEKAHNGPILPGEVLEIGIMLCAVLEYLHTHQPPIIFRDLKPANIMLTPDKRLVLIDFGIARYFKTGQAKDTIPFGSPGYAAPEQYGKAQTTPRSDIYSLGALLHQLLTGNDPADSPFHFAPLSSQPTSALTQLDALIKTMVEVDAEKRPADISIVKQELQDISSDWTVEYKYGLRAKGPYSDYQPPPTFWQNLLPADATGIPVYASSEGQMSMLQQVTAGAGGSGATSTTWTSPIPRKKHNVMAIVSLVFAVLSIFTSLFACASISSLITMDHTLFGFPNSLVIFIFIIPAIISSLAVIFGHIALHRAATVQGLASTKEMAKLALMIGYTILALFIVFILLPFFGI